MTETRGQIDAESRTRRSARNVSVGILAQGQVVLVSFLTRTVFVQQLGVGILGVQTLLMSLLAIAAVAELGVGGALMFALYRPLRTHDDEQVSAVVGYAARLYRWVAFGTAVVGICVIPFLNSLVQLERPIPHLTTYYLVMLAGTVLQYPLNHRVLLLEADQRAYWMKLVQMAFSIGRSIVQVVALLLWHSFFWFLVIQVLSTVLNNLVVYRYVGSQYPYLKRFVPLSDRDRRSIGSSVRAMLVYRISGLALNNTDPILVSVIVGTLALGLYSNYLLIVGSVVMLVEAAFFAVTPTIGNLVASGEPNAVRRVLDELQLVTICVYGSAGLALMVAMDDAIRAWLGVQFVLPEIVLCAVVLNFYLAGAMTPIVAFRVATGMFREARYVLAVTAALNLLLSVVMGNFFGLAGVLFATLASRLCTNTWYEPMILFRRHVSGGAGRYVVTHLKALAVLAMCYAVITQVLSHVGTEPWISALMKGSVALVLVPLALWAVFGRTDAFRMLTQRAAHLLGRARL